MPVRPGPPCDLPMNVEHGDTHAVEAGQEQERGLGSYRAAHKASEIRSLRVADPDQGVFAAREARTEKRPGEDTSGKQEAR